MSAPLILLLWACGADVPADAPAAPAPAPDAPERDRPRGAEGDGEGFAYEGWPGEGIPVVTARDAVKLPVHGKPAGTVVGECALGKDAALTWDKSLVRTDVPGAVTLAETTHLSPDSVSYGPVRRLSKDQQYGGNTGEAPVTVGPSDTVEHLANRAEGWCFYRIGADVISSPCFHDREETAQESWWLQVRCGGAAGWVRVDDREDLKIGRQL